MNRCRVLSFAVFFSAVIQITFGIFFLVTDYIGKPESIWLFIALAATAAVSVAFAVFLLIKSNR